VKDLRRRKKVIVTARGVIVIALVGVRVLVASLEFLFS
jgi:hypothetical protein